MVLKYLPKKITFNFIFYITEKFVLHIEFGMNSVSAHRSLKKVETTIIRISPIFKLVSQNLLFYIAHGKDWFI